ncbi:MAG TPA: thiamine pyrophosphate-dependent enzyme [Thermoguttaceae bacterium]|nr:thiamine pyrophosphate-dependent enzyme [Thermoguttaceae bacterium]
MIDAEKKVFARSPVLEPNLTHYCPGCGHGIAHRLVAEAIEHYGIRERTVCVAPVGCSVLAYKYIAIDMSEAAHGRAPAVATGIKRARPELFVMTYQGDGDLAAIGTAEIVHAANRGENISVVFVNNAVYGMTGGQMAPTTTLGQKTTTTPTGRTMQNEGGPIKVCEMLSALDGPSYIARVTVNKPAAVRKARQAVLTAFGRQLEGKGFSLVEILSPCPTYWRMPPVKAMAAIDEWMVKVFPLGVFKDKESAGARNEKT